MEKKDKNLMTDNYWTVIGKTQTRPLVREGAPQRQDCKFQAELISGRKSHSELDTKTY
jgi:hypothetical protein